MFKSAKALIVVFILGVLAVGSFYYMQKADERDAAEKMATTTPATDTKPVATTPAKPRNPLTGTSWVWTNTKFNATPSKDVAAPVGKFVLLFTQDGKITSTTDCNSLFGSLVVDGTVLGISNIGATKMACLGETLEAEYADELSKVVSYTVTGNELRMTLFQNAGTMTFEKK